MSSLTEIISASCAVLGLFTLAWLQRACMSSVGHVTKLDYCHFLVS